MRPNDVTGQRFGRLVAVERITKHDGTQYRTYYKCVCDCGKEKEIALTNLVGNKTTSCGCVQKENTSKANKGENSPHWRGGVSRLRDFLRTDLNAWRKSVYERDGYTCQKCKTKGGTLHPHHIESFSTCPEKRTEVENGITLCESCHREFHKLYGQSGNNNAQLKDFLVLK